MILVRSCLWSWYCWVLVPCYLQRQLREIGSATVIHAERCRILMKTYLGNRRRIRTMSSRLLGCSMAVSSNPPPLHGRVLLPRTCIPVLSGMFRTTTGDFWFPHRIVLCMFLWYCMYHMCRPKLLIDRHGGTAWALKTETHETLTVRAGLIPFGIDQFNSAPIPELEFVLNYFEQKELELKDFEHKIIGIGI